MLKLYLLQLLLVSVLAFGLQSPIRDTFDQYKNSVDITDVSGKAFYLLENDLRRCAQPKCGGFFLTPLNNDADDEPIYVAEALVENGLDYQLIQNASKSEGFLESSIIVSGRLQTSSNYPEYQCIRVTDIYKAMELPSSEAHAPGVNVGSNVRPKQSYYIMKPSPFLCNRIGKCPPISTLRLGTNEIGFVGGYTEPYTTSIPLLDKLWFKTKLVNNDGYNSIVKGVVINDNLSIGRVFINTKDPKGQCQMSVGNCDHSLGNLVPVYYRDNNRCPVFDTCVPQGPCHLSVPSCPSGYTSSKLITGPKGCFTYYCDPYFIQSTSQVLRFK